MHRRLLARHHCSNTAGFAEVGLVPPQAGGDRSHIRNLAGAETIDVGRTGFFLFGRREFGACWAGRGERDQKTERQSRIGAAGDGQSHTCVRHGEFPGVNLVPEWRRCNLGK
jgi:hypothetical protein